MMTDPASAIKDEVDQLIKLQIRTLRRESSLETTDLLDTACGRRESKLCIRN